MQELICAKFLDQFVLINRMNLASQIIPAELYRVVAQGAARKERPAWAESLLAKVGKKYTNESLDELVFVRPVPKFNYGRGTYETIQKCNFRCKHCVLGERDLPYLSIEKRLALISLMAEAGVVFAHLTGGEITADRHFSEMYSLASDSGMLIDLSTNGSLLWRKDIMLLLSEKPPYKIGISVYGGSEATTNAFTENAVAWRDFIRGMEAICEIGLQSRVFAKIILTTYNQHELKVMTNMLERWGFDFHTDKNTFPTHGGSVDPICVEACDAEELPTTMKKMMTEAAPRDWYERCKAGRNFFHIDSMGMASLCSTARRPAVNLVETGIEGLAELQQISRLWLQTPAQCGDCGNYDNCLSCPPKLAMYSRADVRSVPKYVCGQAQPPELFFTETTPQLTQIRRR